MDNLLTNFRKERMWLFQKTLRALGDNTLYVKEEAVNKNGDQLECYSSLRTTNLAKDKAAFWDLLRYNEKNIVINIP